MAVKHCTLAELNCRSGRSDAFQDKSRAEKNNLGAGDEEAFENNPKGGREPKTYHGPKGYIIRKTPRCCGCLFQVNVNEVNVSTCDPEMHPQAKSCQRALWRAVAYRAWPRRTRRHSAEMKNAGRALLSHRQRQITWSILRPVFFRASCASEVSCRRSAHVSFRRARRRHNAAVSYPCDEIFRYKNECSFATGMRCTERSCFLVKFSSTFSSPQIPTLAMVAIRNSAQRDSATWS